MANGEEDRSLATRPAAPVVLRPGADYDLHGSAAAWRVEEGTAELFVESTSQAWREYLFAVPAGKVVLAFPAAEGLRVVVAGRSSATLRPLDGEAISRTAAAAWLDRLSRALERFAPAVDFIDEVVEPPAHLGPEAGKRIAAAEGIVAIKLGEGQVALLDRVKIAAGPDPCFLPLGPGTWLTATSDARLEAVSWEELDEAAWRPALGRFQHLSLELLGACLAAAFRDEQERLRARAALEERERGAVLARFSAVIDAEDRRPPAAELPPLVAACRRIGEALGVEVLAPTWEPASGRSVTAQIDDVSRRSRLRARQVVLRDRWWLRETRPMLAFRRDGGEPLVLLPGKGRRRVLWTPGEETETAPVTAAVAAEIDPVAWSFYRTLPDRPVGPWRLLRFATALGRRDLALALLYSIAGMVMAMLVPLATAVIIDVAIPAHQTWQLFAVALGLVVGAAAAYGFKVCEDVAILRLQGKMAEALQPAILDRLLRMPNPFFRRYAAGDLAERAKAIELMQNRLSGSVVSALLTGALSALNFTILFALEPTAAAVAAGMLLLLLVGLVLAGFRHRRFWTAISRLHGELSSMVLQMVNGIRRIRLAGAEDRMFVRWGHRFMEYREVLNNCYNAEVLYGAVVRGYQVLSFAVIFGVLARLGDGALTTGRFLAFVAAFTIAMNGFVQLAQTLLGLVPLVPLYRRMQPLLRGIPESEKGKAHPETLSGRIEVHKLHFRYGEGMPWILRGLSLAVAPGENVAIVGPSGCGKSTLLRLILGFEQPTAGSIYFDGKDAAGLDMREVRHQIGVVLQNDELMEATIYENVRGDSDVSLDDAWEAARKAGIAADVEAMPLGMHTVISAQGSDLSGGQVQRLLIARALAARPRILLLDEATSALDNESQTLVTQSLDRLRVTRIAIAHRLSTVKQADRIFVIDQGRVAESGKFDELMENEEGVFARLVRRQL